MSHLYFGSKYHFTEPVDWRVEAKILKKFGLTLDNLHRVFPVLKPIFLYLEGIYQIEQLNITQENSASFLRYIKIIDLLACGDKKWPFARTSYKIRSYILKLNSPQMTTSESYTKSLVRGNYHDWEHLKNGDNWHPKREKKQIRLGINQEIRTRHQSLLFKPQTPMMLAARGNSGCGKTYYLKRAAQEFLHDRCEYSELNPDTFKVFFQREALLINGQVYHESGALAERIFDALLQLSLSTIFDSRLITLEYFEKRVIAPIQCRGGRAIVVDIDVPLYFSLMRMLLRDPFGRDPKRKGPCVTSEPVINGWKQLRIQRRKIWERLKNEPLDINYKLFYIDESGRHHLASEINRGNSVIYDGDAFDKSLAIPSDEETNRQAQRLISDELIEEAICKKIITCSHRSLVETWQGYPLTEALNKHGLNRTGHPK